MRKSLEKPHITRLACWLAIPLLLALLASCTKEEQFITDNDAKLTFSVDTLRFDTVFTELGSATRFFKIYNGYDQSILISSIYLENGQNSFFRLNVDGLPGNELQDIRIWPNDSIYVFAEVTIDPDQPLSVSPFVIEERVVFETNGNRQAVQLEAWGQNANYFPSRFNKGVPVVLSCGGGTLSWDDAKPYVLYGAVFVDSCTLVLPAGARVYVHGGIARNDLFGVYNDGMLYTLSQGAIRSEGTLDDPVIIQGDRLEEAFREGPGQWNGIILGRNSRGNVFEHTTIKNSRFGVLVDSLAHLTLRHCRIYNTASSGVVGFASRITAENSLIYNNGGNSVQLILGGIYDFTYCTIASYGVDAAALGMSNFFCYDDPFTCRQYAVFPLRARFVNSIIYGSRPDEIELSDATAGERPDYFDIAFENCVVAVNDLLTDRDGLYANFLEETCTPCLDPSFLDDLFVDPNHDDYHLDSLSVALQQARPLPGITIDLEGNSRDSQAPDIGCFERQD